MAERSQEPPGAGSWLARSGDSVMWLAAVAVAFTAAVLLLTPLRMSLGWDEAVYASQISHHMPLLPWGPQRARGMPLLIAPVTLLSSSVFVLRVYLTVLAGAGVFVALLAWRGIRPAWVLAVAGVMFAGLGMAQSQASRAFPNFWIALGGLAAVGLFFQGWAKERPPLRILVPLAAAIAFSALMRPADAVFLAAPMLAVAAVALARRSGIRRAVSLLLALLAGLAAGWGDWVFEAYRYFDGPAARFPAANRAVGGTVFDPLASLRILGGGASTQVTGWSHPKLLIWWAAFALLVILGIWVTQRASGWALALVPAACAASIYVLYSFPLKDNARYLLPAWALLALPAAEAVAWVTARVKGRLRLAGAVVAVLFLAAEISTQHAVLTSQSASLEAIARASVNAATDLRHLGVHRPCVITSVKLPYYAPASGPAAYYAHCAYVRYLGIEPVHRRGVVLVQGPDGVPWTYAQDWPAHRLRGTGGIVAYIAPPSPRRLP